LERRFGKKRRRQDSVDGYAPKAKRSAVKDRRTAIRERAYGAISTQGRLQTRRMPRNRNKISITEEEA